MKIGDVAVAIEFIHKLDNQQNLNGILDSAIELFVREVPDIDQNYFRIYMSRLNPEVVEKIKTKLEQNSHRYTLSELIVKLAGSNSWDSKYISYLKYYTINDIYAWIIAEEKLEVITLLSIFLERFGNDREEDNKVVVDNIRSALEKIKERSLFDKFRVQELIERIK